MTEGPVWPAAIFQLLFARHEIVTASDRDVQLMLDFQKGNENAFEEIIRLYDKKIINLVYRYLGVNYAFAEDLAQEVFLRIYRSRDSYKPKAKLSTWIFRIAINLCLNEQRNAKAIRFSELSASQDQHFEYPSSSYMHGEGELSPSDGLEKKELVAQVKRAIDELPGKQKLAIILSRYELMSYDDIADALDCSVQAVKSALFRARESLKKSLSKYLKK